MDIGKSKFFNCLRLMHRKEINKLKDHIFVLSKGLLDGVLYSIISFLEHELLSGLFFFFFFNSRFYWASAS